MSGCGVVASGKPERYDPPTAAAKAIETYDRNGDGQLSAEELRQSPPLAASGRRVDRDGNGVVTIQEIQTRFEELQPKAEYIGLDVRVTSRGQPLVGAQLTLTPEPFMGNGFQTWSGTTIEGGGCPLIGDGAELPGVPVGFYQAKIVHPARDINVVRGVEIASDSTGSRLQIAL